jgi:hypothetical protein
VDTDLAWFPLVQRERPPGRPLEARIAELTRLAEPMLDATSHGRITRACEVLNKAALIASDCGLPTLACALCWRQYELFEVVRPWPSWAIKLAVQPLLNVARQLIREGHGDHAYAMLESLYSAARSQTSIMTSGRVIDFGAFIATPDNHKAVCTMLWTALLADGTRALTQAGHWREAAERVEQHRGVGNRLLDGRQVAIIARIEDGDASRAIELVEQSQITEPWEHAVQRILRVLCLRTVDSVTSADVAMMLVSAHSLARSPDPDTAVARTRISIAALNLAAPCSVGQTEALRISLVDLAMKDAYAAHDVLSNPALAGQLTASRLDALHDLVRSCGLRRGTIPSRLRDQLMAVVGRAAATLANELEHTPPITEVSA